VCLWPLPRISLVESIDPLLYLHTDCIARTFEEDYQKEKKRAILEKALIDLDLEDSKV
jgi:hypothetical protein